MGTTERIKGQSKVDHLRTQVLYNQVRVKTSKAGGSGTVIYSALGEDSKQYNTYVLTCHHVVSDAISIKSAWDSRIGRDRKQELRQLVTVEFFNYLNVPHGYRPVSSSVDAEIVAYDDRHDMALLHLRTIQQAEHVAQMLKPADVEVLQVGMPLVAVGAALLHDPIVTQGHLTHMGDEIDHALYMMSSAQIIFGNSGGAMFGEVDDVYQYVGIPSRIDIAGWSSPVTHLGYFSPAVRIHEFLQEQLYCFLIPGHEHTGAHCATERKERKEREERRLQMTGPE